MANYNKPCIFRRMTTLALSAVMAATCFTAVPSVASAADSIGIIDDADGKFYPIEADGAVSKEWDGSIASSFAGGTGTESNPYLISNGSELAYLAKVVNSGIDCNGMYFKLTNDILLNSEINDNSKQWTPIGLYDNKAYAFNGVFDGENHNIIGLYINDLISGIYQNYVGLFGYNYGEIKNIRTVDGMMACDRYFNGGICGQNSGIINNCNNAVNIFSSSSCDYYGGICGWNSGSVNDCRNSGVLQLNGGDANFSKSDIGGICGYNKEGTISNCYNTGAVCTIEGGYTQNVGGICGRSGYGIINNCYNLGNVSGYIETGGICGNNNSSTINNCRNDGLITGGYQYVGGICGLSHSSKDVDMIIGCYNTGNIKNTYPSNVNGYTGGICGELDGYLIRLCQNTGNVNSVGTNCLGGINGYCRKGRISECFNLGTIYSQYEYVGGISGYLFSKCNVENCYNIGKVKGKSSVGGIWGALGNVSDNSISYCLSIADVSGTDKYIFPIGENFGQILNVYYSSDICKTSDNTNSKWARTTEQLTAPTVLTDLGFDTDVWEKPENVNGYFYYPRLKNVGDYKPCATVNVPYIIGYKAGDGKVKLEWRALDGAEMYRVYYYLNGKYTRVFTTDGSRTIATVSGLTGGTKYGFVVSAKVNGAWTAYNDPADLVYVTPTGTPKPSIVGYKVGENKVKLQWNEVPGAEMYRVYYLLNGKYTRVFTTDGSRTIATVSGLSGGTEYGFVVSAKVNGAWTSYNDAADLVYATPTGTAKPFIIGCKPGDGKVKLEWQAVPKAEMYRVYYYLNGKYTRAFTTNGSRTIATVSGLNNGTTYAFIVSAKAKGVWTDYTNSSEFVYAKPNA